MLPKKLHASSVRWLWIVLLSLSPLAYLLGARLVLKQDTAARLGLSIDRARAVSIAADFASTKGVEVSGWQPLSHFKFNKNVFFYNQLGSRTNRDIGDGRNTERQWARALAPDTVVGVLFRSPDHNENFEVELAVDGHVLGYQRRSAQTGQENDPGEPAARKLAQDALQLRLSAMGLSYPVELKLGESRGNEEIDPDDKLANSKGIVRKYTWSWPFQTIPELKLESVLTVRNGLLFGDRIEAKVDDGFAKEHLHSGGWLKIASATIYSIVLVILIIYGLYRFVQRARQKEVSYFRVGILVALFAGVMVGFQTMSDTVVYPVASIPGISIPDWVLLLQIGVSMLFIGLFMGLAYGSGEGDIREQYPGKLSSLDALLLGKLFSRNVGRSTLWGWAIGGWMLMMGQILLIPWSNVPGTGRAPSEYLDSWLGHAAVLSPLMTWPLDTMLVLVIGLLLPLPFLYRRPRLRRIKFPLLFVCAWIACSGPYLDFHPWTVTLLTAFSRAALFLFAIFYFDVLTAIIAIASPPFISFALALLAQPASSLHRAGMVSLAFAFLVLAVEIYFAVRGRLYREEDVRPLYASNLAERLSMQAEVSAAREAQVRLMPVDLPRTDCFSIAASFKPAFEVGGDYYDVFELEAGKIGILIAEGGGQGLGAALSIAYAKGFLMPKIRPRYQTDDSPVEILRGLQDRLSSLLDKDSGVGLAYAVIDAADGSLRYARTGDHPALLVAHTKGKGLGVGLLLPEEQKIRFSSHQNAEAELSIVEGTATLNAGDSVVLFTDGLTQNWQQNKTNPENEFASVLNASKKSTDSLQESLTGAIADCAKRARKQGLEDDLTAVIVRLDKIGLDEEVTANTSADWRNAE